MSDPIRHKSQVKSVVDVTYHLEGVDTPMRLYMTLDKKLADGYSKEQMEEALKQALSFVSPTPVSGIHSTHAVFQFVDPDALKDFDFGNTLVEVHLPYCLHIPNEHEFKVNIAEENINALVTLRKIWTDRAATEEGRSSDVDFYAEDRVLYFKSSTILGPRLPLKPDKGWEQHFTGINIEKIKEQDGVFRYTKLYIQFDFEPDVTKLETMQGGAEELEKVRQRALKVVNRIIDCYRYVTDQEHIQRLGSLAVNLIYFLNHERGYHIMSLGAGIETAPMNRSENEVTAIGDMLKKGEKPDLYSLLVLDARSSFDNKDFALAVIQSFQALEIFLENLLFSDLKKRGDAENDIINYLEKNWRTKERLKTCLKELKGTSLVEVDKLLWDRWCVLYDQVRNEIIHKSKEPSSNETAEMLDKNMKVITLLKSL